VKLAVRANRSPTRRHPSIASTAGSPAVETWIDYGSGFTEYVDVNHTARR